MLRLFLSVDIAGSTLFKSSGGARLAQGEAHWLPLFRTFFTNVPLMLEGEIGLAFIDDDHAPAVDVWKVLGDELIFSVKLTRRAEVARILLALLRTIRAFEEEHLAHLPLRLKGAAWVAAFPYPNIEVEIPELSSGNGGRHIDYIGPDIDLGFRIGKFARPNCLVVSVDLVELLLAAEDETICLTIVSREVLKGVAFERPYPVIWMRPADMPFDFMPWEIEDDALIARAMTAGPADPEDLRKVIGNMRLYLSRMHGLQTVPPVLE
jgi:hypothetical protein